MTDWKKTNHALPNKGQHVWICIETRYTNAKPERSVSEAWFDGSNFRDVGGWDSHTFQWPTHWMPREIPEPPSV